MALALLLAAGVAEAQDTTAPEFDDAWVKGHLLQVTFDEELAFTGTPQSAFTVTATPAGSTSGRDIGGDTGTVTRTPNSLIVELTGSVVSGETVTVSYAKPTSGALRDAAGNEVAGFSGEAVTNLTPPTLSRAVVNGQVLELVFDADLDPDSKPARFQFTVTVGDARRGIVPDYGVLIFGATVSLPLASAVAASDTVKVGYSRIGGSNPLRDAAGNEVEGFSDQTVTNSAGVLVSNTGQTAATASFLVGDDGTAQWEHGAVFSTGGNPHGYALTGVDVRVHTAGATPQVSVYETDVGPTTSLHALTNPAAVTAAVNTFTADAGAKLEPNTSYAVVAQIAGASGSYRIARTDTSDDDAGAASGWVIHTRGATKVASAAFWRFPIVAVPMIAVRGVPIVDPTPPALVSALVTGDKLTLTFDDPLGAAASLANSAFAVTRTELATTGIDVGLSTSTAPSVSGRTVVLTLASAIGDSAGYDYKVSYTKPASGAANRIVNAAGLEAESFSEQAVPRMLVSNANQKTAGSSSLTRDRAQSFRTGGPAAGYTLTHATFRVQRTSTAAPTYTVSVHSDAGGSGDAAAPGASLGTLTNPPSLPTTGADALFTATGDGIDLDTNTTYWLQWDTSAANSAAGQVLGAGFSEDPGGAPGWSIATTTRERAADNVVWTYPYTFAFAQKIIIYGHVKPDFQPPSFASASVNRTTLSVTFDEALDGDSVPEGEKFSVRASTTIRGTGTPVISGATVTVVLASAVAHGDEVALFYEADSATPLQDAAGNEVLGFNTSQSPGAVTNNTPSTDDVTAPAFSSATVNGHSLTVAFDEALNTASAPAGASFSVSARPAGGTARSIAGTGTATVSGTTATVTLASRVGHGDTVTASYSKPDDNPLQDAVGNQVADFSAEEVTNNTPEDGPKLVSGTIRERTVRLYFSEPLDTSGSPAASQFAVTGSPDNLGAVSNPTIHPTESNILTLTMANAAAEGQAVTVTIADTTGIAGVGGQAAPAVTAFALTNVLGGDPPAPALTGAAVDADALTLTYDQRLLGRYPPPADFSVTTSATDPAPTVSGVAIAPGTPSTVTLGLSAAVKHGETVTVSYSKATAPWLQNEWGAQAPPLSGEAVTNNTAAPPPKTRPPGGGGGGTRPPDPPDPPANKAPETAVEIEDAMLRVGTALEIDLADAFEDPDDDDLEYAASSSDPGVAAVELDGAALTVRAAGPGDATITTKAEDPDGATATQWFEVAVRWPETVWYLPPNSDPLRQGFVRVINHSDEAGEATVTATDDAGVEYEPLTLALGPREARHFNSEDLELGNADKGLSGATGPGTGAWRLVVESDEVDVEALAYARAADGFLTALNAVAPREDGLLEIAVLNPGSNVDQTSLLRLVNPSEEDAEATVTGVDDAGASPGAPVLLELPAGSACTLDAAQLESGAGLACGSPQAGLGDGAGKWRLTVEAEAPLVAMSLLESPAGHLTNLSGKAAEDEDGVWHVDLFPAASDPYGRQGFVRVTNRSTVDGTVTILAYDDSNVDYDTLRLRLGAGESRHFNSDDLELGNRAKGLTGSTGSGRGTWRLRMYSGLDIDANAYVRTLDGFLTAMQARAPAARPGRRVAMFNPGSNANSAGVLRLVNRSPRDAEVAIDGTDDRGVRPGATVRVLVPATDAVELTAAELESGEADAIASGALGDGAGKWRLRVQSSRVNTALSLLSTPAGHLTNVSGADPERELGPLPAALLPAPETVTLESPDRRELRGRWSAVEGARYDVELVRDGRADEDRSLSNARNTTTTFRWTHLLPGTYTIRARSVNEDRLGGPWRTSEEVEID